MVVYEFFDTSLDEDAINQRMSVYNTISIVEVLHRYRRLNLTISDQILENKKIISDVHVKIDANIKFYEVKLTENQRISGNVCENALKFIKL